VPAALTLGLAAEAAAYSWSDVGHWLPDLAVGLTFIGCGAFLFEAGPDRGGALLFGATGVAWFLGNFSSQLTYLHRGLLANLLVAYPRWRPRARIELAAVGAIYVASLIEPLWRHEATNFVYAGLLVALTLRARREALAAAVLLAAVITAGAAARLIVSNGDAIDPALLAYEAALAIVAVGLTWRARRPISLVADLVVELGESRSGTLRDRLAVALGDPTLAIGWWSADAGAYLDDSGAELPVTRSAIPVERDGLPFALVVHDAAALDDPALVEAVASATRLSTSNVALRASVRSQADELIASRRRLLLAGDSERRRLEARLREGPERRLHEADAALASLDPAGEHLERARVQLERTLTDLAELGRGLHPRELVEEGLEGALRSLAERAGLPVELRVSITPVSDELAATAYFVCAEALANVSKYAGASRAVIDVESRNGRLRIAVEDDGRGGADPARGSGLRGLGDRVEALGGTLRVESPPGRGTRLAAELPLEGEPR